MKTCLYDDSLRVAVDTIRARLPDFFERSVYLRDGKGRMHVYVPEEVSDGVIASAEIEMRLALGNYVPTFGPVIKIGQPSGAISLVVVGDERVRYIDRRFSGIDWAVKPTPLASPPRLVFYSIKGGVGRTTALVVLATALASAGKRILAVDLDLEAPGLGSALLEESELPEFGALDWLVERATQGDPSLLTNQILSTSKISRDFGGIDVVPAFGSRCLSNPMSILSKLSRVVVEDIGTGRQDNIWDTGQGIS